jgi:hypothetical protein
LVDEPELQEITELDEIRPDDEPELDENGQYTTGAKAKGRAG